MSANRPPQTGKRKAPSTAFKPGQSGNPSGRPAQLREVVDLARQHTPEALQRLVFWARSDHPSASPKACEVLLDRGWGKPMQPNEHTGKDGEPLLIPSVAITITRDG